MLQKLASLWADLSCPNCSKHPWCGWRVGIGITPFISQLKLPTETGGNDGPFVYFGRSAQRTTLFFRMSWRRPQHRNHIVSKAQRCVGRRTRSSNRRNGQRPSRPRKDSLIFLSGPEPFVDSLKGLPARQVVTDSFLATAIFSLPGGCLQIFPILSAAVAPSPAAEAICMVAPERISPAANTPGTLVWVGIC